MKVIMLMERNKVKVFILGQMDQGNYIKKYNKLIDFYIIILNKI